MSEETPVHVDLEDAGPLEKRLRITIPADQVEDRFATAYRRLRREVELPGFRKGKVPRKLLEKRFGERVADEVTPELAARALADAIAQHGLETVGEPDLDLGEAQPGEPFRFSATLALRPRPTVSDYCGVPVVRQTPTLSDDDLEEHLESMRLQSGVLEKIEEDRPAADGDVVDLTLTLQDEEYGDLVREHQLVSLPEDPSHPFVLGLVRGLRPGETDAGEVTIPDGYVLPDWAGRTCRAALMVHEIKSVRAAPLDAAFAQRMGYDSVEALREALRSQLLEMMNDRARNREVRSLIEALIERNPFDVPRPMVTERAQTLVESIAAQLMDGMSQAMSPSLDDLDDEKRSQVLEEAEFSARRELILEAIGRQEAIHLEEEEFDAGIEAMAAQTGQPAEALRSALLRGGKSSFEAKLRDDKIIEWLLERAEIVTDE